MLKLLKAEMERNEGITCINNLTKSFETIENEYMKRWREIELAKDNEDDIEMHNDRVEREHNELYAEHRETTKQFVDFAGRKMFEVAQVNNTTQNSKAAYVLWEVSKYNARQLNPYSFGEMLRRFYDYLTDIDTESDPWK